jgi:hypothetical protein
VIPHARPHRFRPTILGALPGRPRLLLATLALAILGAVVAFWLARPSLERRLGERIVAAAKRQGLIATVRAVHVGVWPLARLEGVSVTAPGRFRVVAESARVSPALWGHGLSGLAWRIQLGQAFVSLPVGVEVDLAPLDWKMRRTREGFLAWRRAGEEHIDVDWARGGVDAGLRVRAANLDLTDRLTLRQRSVTVSDLGTIEGELSVRPAAAHELRIELRGRSRGLRLSALDAPRAGSANGDGRPTDATLELRARVWPGDRALEVAECRLTAGGATLRGRGRVWGGLDDPQVDLFLAVDHLDFADLLATAGLELPADAHDLGSAAFDASVAGRLRDPASFVVKQHLEFDPPRAPIPALEKLKGPFEYEARPPHGAVRRIAVSPDSPDFISLDQVPPLFVRALIVSEDAGYYGHRGIDLGEVPGALATNWLRGTSARGASTIPQQLAKNLFLSREKSLSRKLQELALALLLDATLGKSRLLEIYLNVIEWGPDIYGLRPAARHYFGKEPRELTPKEMAFLVCLIPGPLKYQRSFADGTLSPTFETMVATLLGKLRSVDALGEEEYQAALGETLLIRPNGAEWGEAPAPGAAGEADSSESDDSAGDQAP